MTKEDADFPHDDKWECPTVDELSDYWTCFGRIDPAGIYEISEGLVVDHSVAIGSANFLRSHKMGP